MPNTSQRLSRAAAFAFTATLAVAGCGDTVTPPASDAAADTAVIDSGGPAPLYGAPVDSGSTTTDAGGPPDDGAIVAMYGTPAPTDASAVKDTGGGGVRYGAPPPRDV